MVLDMFFPEGLHVSLLFQRPTVAAAQQHQRQLQRVWRTSAPGLSAISRIRRQTGR
jgi:hypothetical protein